MLRAMRKLILLVCTLTSIGLLSAPNAMGAPFSSTSYTAKDVCTAPFPGTVGCLSRRLISHYWTPQRLAQNAAYAQASLSSKQHLQVNNPTPPTGAYTPADIRAAYSLPSSTTAASSQVIGIVDAYDDPNAAADLSVYSSQWGLPPCTTSNGCFEKVGESGSPSSLPAVNGSWAVEESLDVQMAHAICPQCRIILVEASSTSFSDIEASVKTAISLGATEVSNSYGGEESSSLTGDTGYTYPGVVITAAAGDYGYEDWLNPSPGGAPDYPASSPDTVAVGGTSLTGSGSTWSSVVWDDSSKASPSETGGGCSTIFTAQPWQTSLASWSQTGCGTGRLVSDVSAVGDPYTGVAIYDSYPDGSGDPTGWIVLGGTSVATPIIAAEFALAGGSQGIAYPAQTLYSHLGNSSDLYDVVSGTSDDNHVYCSATSLACNAAVGYDGPSGVGSPLGLGAFIPSFNASGGTAPQSASPPTVFDTTSADYTNGDVIRASRGAWTGGAPLSYTYQWERCSSSGTGCYAISGATSATYATGTYDSGETLRVEVTAANSAGSQTVSSAATPVISGTSPAAPANSTPPTISDSTSQSSWVVGDKLQASPGTWSGTQPISYAFEWCTSSASASDSTGTEGICTPGYFEISNATSSTYTVQVPDEGNTLEVVVSATNYLGSHNASSASTPQIIRQAPTNTEVPSVVDVSSTFWKVGDTLQATDGSWTGNPTLYAYQWQVCNSSGLNCQAISGATGEDFILTSSYFGSTLDVIVIATNPGGSQEASSAVTPQIAATPVNISAPNISGVTQDGETLTVNTGSWSYAFSYSFQWLRCTSSCMSISGATSQTYLLSPQDVGTYEEVIVTASSAGGLSAQATSAPTGPVRGLPPVLRASPSISGKIQARQSVTAAPGSWSSDDGAIAYSFEWLKCAGLSCTPLAEGSSYTIPVALTGHELAVLVTAANIAGQASARSALVRVSALSRNYGIIRLQRRTLSVRSAKAILGLSCLGGSCHGISLLEKARYHKKPLILSRISYSLVGGEKRLYALRLPRNVQKILRRRHRLSVQLVLAGKTVQVTLISYHAPVKRKKRF